MAAHQEHQPDPKNEAAQKQSRAQPAQPGHVALALEVSPLALQRAIADPGAASPRDILVLQRLAGNRAVTRLIQSFGKLTVGPAGDKYEQEADRMADQVASGQPSAFSDRPAIRRQAEEEEEEVQTKPSPNASGGRPLAASITPLVQRQAEEEEEVQTKLLVQRQAEEEEEVQAKPLVQRQAMEEEEVQTKPLVQRQPEEEEIQTKSLVRRQADEEEEVQTKSKLQPSTFNPQAGFEAGPDVESRLAAHKGSGSLLPDDVRATMESRFGADFGGVRVHTGGEADQLNRQLSAQAFTRGHDIYMAAGKYAPGTLAGNRLLAHELTHVVQQCPETGQTGGPVVQRDDGYTKDPAFRRRLAKRRLAIMGDEEEETGTEPLPGSEAQENRPQAYTGSDLAAKEKAAARLASVLNPRRMAIVNAKAHTRVVTGPLAGDADQRARQINKSRMLTLYRKGDIIPLEDNDSLHAKDKGGNVVWYRVKKGTPNEYIRAEKVLLGARPDIEGMEKKGEDGKVEKAFGVLGWAGEATSSADERLVEELRGLTAGTEKFEKAIENLPEEQQEALKKRNPLYAQQAKVSYAEGAVWAGSGLLGMAVSLKGVVDDEKSAWERVQAAFNFIASGEGVLGGVTQIISGATEGKTSEVTTGISAFALGYQEFFSGLANLVKTAKSGVDIVKMVAEQAQGKRHGRDEWLQAGSSLLQGALETLKSAARTARAIHEALGGAVTSTASQVLSNIAIGFDIAIAAVKSVFQGYYLAISARQWWLMSQRKKELKGELAQKGYAKEKVKESRGAYRRGEAMKATLDQLIAKNEKAIAAKQDKIVNMSTKGPQWLLKRRLAKVKTLQDEIAALEKQNEDYKAQKKEAEDQMKAREEMREGGTIVDATGSTGKTSVPGVPTRSDLAEVELASELGAANRKRVVRQAIHIGANLVQIAGSIAALVSGPGAPAAIGLKAAAAGVETSLPFFRAIKQFGRNVAAKNIATTGKKGIAGRIFNADKSTAAKLESRKKQAVLILMMVADLNKLIPKVPKPTSAHLAPLKKQMARVEGYIVATGCGPEKLYRANGKPQEQVKILVEELSKREFGE
jgi:hypothetical protein